MTRPRAPLALGLLGVLLGACIAGGSPFESEQPSSDRPTPSAAESVGAAIVPLSCPDGLAVDAAGILYAADVCTNRVLQFSPDEGWSSFAGTGAAGYSGDGGPATEAELEYVGGVLVDDEGTVFITECGGNVVRTVAPDGIITTLAGVGGMGAGNGGYSGDGGQATEAELACPSDGALDGVGNLYLVDRDNSVVRRVDASGVITTIAGGGSLDTAGAGSPAEGLPATEARFPAESPVHVVVDAAGNVYLADEKAHRVWKVDSSGILTTFAGTGVAGFSGDGGPASQAELNGPYGLALDGDGNLHVGDYENARIRRIDPDGIITTVVGNGEVGTAGDGGPAIEAQLQSPYGLVVDVDGNLYIADQENARIRIVDAQGIIRSLEDPN
jgi:sugar lactone lactonase YvrE